MIQQMHVFVGISLLILHVADQCKARDDEYEDDGDKDDLETILILVFRVGLFLWNIARLNQLDHV